MALMDAQTPQARHPDSEISEQESRVREVDGLMIHHHLVLLAVRHVRILTYQYRPAHLRYQEIVQKVNTRSHVTACVLTSSVSPLRADALAQ